MSRVGRGLDRILAGLRRLRPGAKESLGRAGERIATRHLRRSGYRILERNLRVGKDEADLVALDPDGVTIVIVEVKARRDPIAPAEAAVGFHKQHRLNRLAASLQRREAYRGRPFRFDVVAVEWDDRGRIGVRHVPAAFEARFG